MMNTGFEIRWWVLYMPRIYLAKSEYGKKPKSCHPIAWYIIVAEISAVISWREYVHHSDSIKQDSVWHIPPMLRELWELI